MEVWGQRYENWIGTWEGDNSCRALMKLKNGSAAFWVWAVGPLHPEVLSRRQAPRRAAGECNNRPGHGLAWIMTVKWEWLKPKSAQISLSKWENAGRIHRRKTQNRASRLGTRVFLCLFMAPSWDRLSLGWGKSPLTNHTLATPGEKEHIFPWLLYINLGEDSGWPCLVTCPPLGLPQCVIMIGRTGSCAYPRSQVTGTVSDRNPKEIRGQNKWSPTKVLLHSKFAPSFDDAHL